MKIKNLRVEHFNGSVYNIHCVPNENYFANGLLVHNCYKGNTSRPATNMTFGEFKNIIDKFPQTLTQIAFGITGVQTNPDFVRMLEYCNIKGIVPNFTLSGIDLTDKLADEISPLIGAVAVSVYENDKNVGYDTVVKFLERGVTQTNIHLMVSRETLNFVYEVLNDISEDERLRDLHAVVFLGVKPKGRAVGKFHSLSVDEYRKLVKYCLARNIRFGFDSCSAQKFEAVVDSLDMSPEWKAEMKSLSESCESSCFSTYLNVYGEMWHCSFSEHERNVDCVDVAIAKDFMRDVWYAPRTIAFRNRVLATEVDGCRKCVTFPEVNVNAEH